jgi:MoaA/NifB/PqqE/SkfB family radical SAM enzyme
MDRMDVIVGLLNGIDRIIDRGIISKPVMRHMLNAFLGNVMLNEDAKRIERKQGNEPPSFVVISPTGKCNLRCKGCYAADAALRGKELSFEVFDRILREKREIWGSHWTVISGGEPFLWRNNDWDLIKLAKRHPYDVFMVYTNGTLIDDEFAACIAEAGNIAPAISVEGFQSETDARRGEGIHLKIMLAFSALRKHGVPFAISVTATRDNWDLITSNEFVDFYFMEQGALFGWIFQYMPMGRDQRLDMMVPPESRVEMARRMWRLVRERKIFLIDFWNSATVSQGCIAAARYGGYFHINWDGDIMPCVFTPYAADNINEIYARGGDLSAAIKSPFFEKIRNWQREYGFHKSAGDTGNWLCPCAIRDHFDTFADAVISCGARSINDEARQAIDDPFYYEGMLDYGNKMADLTEHEWLSCYTNSEEERAR